MLPRLSNGSYIGLISEILEGSVETSVAGFARNLERDALVDYTPGLYKSIVTILIRRPSQEDFSLRYFTLEFTSQSWALLLCAYIITFFILSGIIFTHEKLENTEENTSTDSVLDSVTVALQVTLRAIINKVSFFFTFYRQEPCIE